jgi:hypothetical protein
MMRSKPLSGATLETKIGLHSFGTCRVVLKNSFACVIATALGLLGCLSLRAEEQTSFSSFQPHALFHDEPSLSSGPASFIVSLATAGPSSHEPFHLLQTFHLTSIFQKIEREDDLEFDSSVTLFRKPMRSSRFAYHSWADFRTGWGQYFSTETFGRSRTNGVGFNEPDFIYIKMSLRF